LSRFEQGMNPEQIEAIRHTDGPCRVMAVAGAGKTRALVHRIARMVDDGIDPRRILAVTFSKKAADEMNDRLRNLGVSEARVGTWHSLCLQILREDETTWGQWQIDDRGRLEVIIKEAIGHKYLNWQQGDPKAVGRYISICKANLAMPGSDAAAKFAGSDAQKLLGAYYITQKLLEASGILTFDDFLVNAWQHLSSEDVRQKWSSRWSYLLQDEHQDSNPAQNAIASLLARDHANYMIVGDPAQAIYGFRGSDPKFIMEFENEWGGRTINMNRNYRSGSQIIDLANKIISPAAIRLPVEMISERGTAGSVRVVSYDQQDDQARELAKWVQQVTAGDGARYSDVAVLYRCNAQSRAPEEALLKARVPYAVKGGVSFYDRREVRNVLAYLRVASGSGDMDDVRRCINAPFRYLGTAFVERVAEAVSAIKDKPIDDDDLQVEWIRVATAVARQAGIQDRQRESVRQWATIISDLRDMRESPANEALRWLVSETEYIEWLRRDEGEEDTENSHVENVRELIRVAEKFGSFGELLAYVDQMRALSERNRANRKLENKVILMSIHSSKGLEWPYVFIAGFSEGWLPHAMGDREEERRLAYVAVTRARDQLLIGTSRKRPSPLLIEAGLVSEGKE